MLMEKGVLIKDMAAIDKYLQTWKLKLSTTKTVFAAFHNQQLEKNNQQLEQDEWLKNKKV